MLCCLRSLESFSWWESTPLLLFLRLKMRKTVCTPGALMAWGPMRLPRGRLRRTPHACTPGALMEQVTSLSRKDVMKDFIKTRIIHCHFISKHFAHTFLHAIGSHWFTANSTKHSFFLWKLQVADKHIMAIEVFSVSQFCTPIVSCSRNIYYSVVHWKKIYRNMKKRKTSCMYYCYLWLYRLHQILISQNRERPQFLLYVLKIPHSWRSPCQPTLSAALSLPPPPLSCRISWCFDQGRRDRPLCPRPGIQSGTPGRGRTRRWSSPSQRQTEKLQFPSVHISHGQGLECLTIIELI